MVIRVPYAGGIGGVEHHCDSSEAYYAHTPGPARGRARPTPPDAYALLRAAIASDDPVVFLEPKKLYWRKEEVDLSAAGAGHRPAAVRPRGHRRDADRLRALGAGRAGGRRGRRPGGPAACRSSTCARSCRSTTRPSARRSARTGRAVVVAEATGFASVSSEIVARVTERCFHSLAAPIRRVTGFDIPYPPPKLEHFQLPGRGPDPRRRRRPAVGGVMSDPRLPAARPRRGPDRGRDRALAGRRGRRGRRRPARRRGRDRQVAGRGAVAVRRPGRRPCTAPPGETVAVGHAADHRGRARPTSEAAGRPAEAYREEEKAGSGNVLIGYGTVGRRPAAAGAVARGHGCRAAPRRRAPTVAAPARPRVPLVVSPLVRRLARDLEIDLHALDGSGRGRR